jgi:hypothetical protein
MCYGGGGMMRKLLVLVALCLMVGVTGAVVNDYNASLVLLLHTNQSPANPTWFNDSAKDYKFTNYGTPTTSTALKYLGNASGSFDGAGDYLTTPYNSDHNFGNSDFTISVWFNITSYKDSVGVYGNSLLGTVNAANSKGYQLVAFSTTASASLAHKLTWVSMNTTGSSWNGTTTIPLNTWHQAVVTRSGSITRIYLDGVLENTTYAIETPNNGALAIATGYSGHDANYDLSGNIDELAIWKGVAIPIAELYPQIDEIGYYNGSAPVAPVAAFSCTPTSVTIGQSIACTDESSDIPTNWTYYWGDGNVTDGTQNPS